MRGATCCEQDASLAVIRRALRFERIVANADVATTTYAYDANGNLVQAGGWSYVWDYLNRMLASGFNNSTTTYAYDPAGNRVLQTSTTSATYYPNKYYSLTSTKSGANTYATSTNYVFNGDTLLATIDQALYNGAATGSPITRYIHPDHLGSTNAVTDQNGNLVQLLDYYPYGATRISTSTYPTNEKRQYIGQFSDAQTNLSYLNARFYDSTRGQFTSQDPVFWGKQNLTDPQSLNAYSYAQDNPVTKKVPNGLAATPSTTFWQAVVNFLQSYVSYLQGGGSSSSGGGSGGSGASTPNSNKSATQSSSGGGGGSSASSAASSYNYFGGGWAYGGGGFVASAIPNINKFPFGNLPDDTLICRGGPCTAGKFFEGAKVTSDGSLTRVSVQVGRNGETADQPLQQLPARFGGEGKVTTYGQLKSAGIDLVQQGNDMNHGEMGKLGQEAAQTAEEMEGLFNEVEPYIQEAGSI